MKTVSIQDLKAGLSSAIDEAIRDDEILITRHNRPVARLSAAERQNLRAGSRFGSASLRPVLRGKTRGRYLEVLDEDRRGVPGKP